jgi:EmrB/QacA subfamily drug resistance transporter
MPETTTSAPAALGGAGRAPALGAALLVIATAQLMMVLDDTVANVALPSIRADLDMTVAALPWVINAYVLAFGGLLLLGGRAGDLFGRRRMVRLGLVVFTVASVIGGLAPTGGLLIGARAVQGVGAALVAPNVLALVATTFPAGTPRTRAMAVYGAMSALGITGGVLLGGLLTASLGWRWVLLVNLPIGIAVLVGTRVLTDGRPGTGRLDTIGAATGTGGFVALAYAFTRAGEHGWTDVVTLATSGAAVVVLAVFVVLQARGRHPVLPLRLLADRNRSGAYATVLVIGAGLMGTFYLATLFLQQVMQFGPLQAGAAALPFGVGIVVASGVASGLVGRLSPRRVAVPGLLLAAGGMLWLSRLEPDAGYWTDLMVPLFLTSAGLGLAFVPLTLTVVHGVDEREVGVASAVMNTAQQLGAALGLAVLTTVATSTAPGTTPEALAQGYTTAYAAAAGALVVAAAITAVAVDAGPHGAHRSGPVTAAHAD